MKFVDTPLVGSFLIETEARTDTRGFFARAFCRHEFEAHALVYDVAQCNISFNVQKGTLRGMHYQIAPHQEVKLVRCTAGAIYDVIIDLRADSPTFCRWFGIELSCENRRMLYVPRGFAHGYLTLRDSSEVFYQVSEFYQPSSERGVRWNDPTICIQWPLEPRVISEKDRAYPNLLP